MKTTILALAALLLLAGAPLRAQDERAAAEYPACAEGGISRMAVTVPPGQTREELMEALQQSPAFPQGTQIRVLSNFERPAIANEREFVDRWGMHHERLLRRGIEVNGLAPTLVEVDADGVVTAVKPSSGNRDVDRTLRDLWMRARFEPTLVGQCRAPAWLHMTLQFTAEYTNEDRSQGSRIAP